MMNAKQWAIFNFGSIGIALGLLFITAIGYGFGGYELSTHVQTCIITVLVYIVFWLWLNRNNSTKEGNNAKI